MLASLKDVELVWIDQPQKLRDHIADLAAQDVIAVDTESNSLYAYQEQVCLIQFSTRDKDYLIDSMALPDLSDLATIFSSNRILKVFHAAEYDLICLFRDYGFQFNFLFDTMIAARTLGHQKIGLGALLEAYFSIHMDKKYQRANWGKRPLKPDMLEYARLDSRFLIPLQEKMREELEDSGLWKLALEDFERQTQGIEDTTSTSNQDFWKLPGARDLNPKQAAVLKSLFDFRDSQAKKQNRPPFKVISHQALVEIAQACPKDQKDLTRLSTLSESWINRYGSRLIQAVRDGKKAPPEHPPRYKRPENAVLDRIDAMREWRKLTGRQLGVPSNVVLPRDILLRIAWSDPCDLQALEAQMEDVPYRFHRFGEELLNILNHAAQAG